MTSVQESTWWIGAVTLVALSGCGSRTTLVVVKGSQATPETHCRVRPASARNAQIIAMVYSPCDTTHGVWLSVHDSAGKELSKQPFDESLARCLHGDRDCEPRELTSAAFVAPPKGERLTVELRGTCIHQSEALNGSAECTMP
jgi:hypothetical protein